MSTSTDKFKLSASFRSAIRRAWLWSPVRTEALRLCKVRPGYHICAECKAEVHYKEAHVDHIVPFSPLEGFKSLHDIKPAVARLFDLDNQQVLCKPCHKKKTDYEAQERKRVRSLGKLSPKKKTVKKSHRKKGSKRP